MIFYQVLGTSAAPCCLVGTQVDAKRLARERGTSWEQVDVPTDKTGLMEYVNGLKAKASSPLVTIENQPLTRDEILNSNTHEAQSAAKELMRPDLPVAPGPKFTPLSLRPEPRLHPSIPTVDLMVDMIDRGDIDARGLSNMAESIAHRFQKISQELVA